MNDRINALLAETHNELREQLSAAQRHFQRLEDLLASRESKGISALNGAVRRMRASNNGDWADIVDEAASSFAGRAALFTVQGAAIHLKPSRGRIPLEPVSLNAAPAFRSAVETKDTLVAVRTRGEMSAPVAEYFGESASDRFYLFPILTGGRVAALLYADGPRSSLQTDALELLAALAGAIVDRNPVEASDGLVNIAGSFSAGENDMHLKAKRFARVLVAEMFLYHDEQVKSGRAARDLYASLKAQIDEARESYRSAFLANPDEVPDYFHQELVNTLANGDVEVLGQDYPGPLV